MPLLVLGSVLCILGMVGFGEGERCRSGGGVYGCWVSGFLFSFSFSSDVFFNSSPSLKGGVLEEALPLMTLSSLFVLEFVVPEAFGDWGEVSLDRCPALSTYYYILYTT